jgi:hypothetical protein
MTTTFENDSEVIIYALEKIVSFAREKQYLFVANCVWWIASVIGLEQGLIIHIDNLKEHEQSASLVGSIGTIHPDKINRISLERAVSSTPRDLTEDQRIIQTRSIKQRNRVNPLPQSKNQLKKARRVERLKKIAETKDQRIIQTRSIRQRNRVNPLPQSKKQLKEARRVERLKKKRGSWEVERNKRLLEIRATDIENLSKE